MDIKIFTILSRSSNKFENKCMQNFVLTGYIMLSCKNEPIGV